MTAPEDWRRFDTGRPRLSPLAIGRALDQRFGLRGRLALLAEEREQVLLLETDHGARFVVRVSCRDQLSLSAVVQNIALDAVAAADPSLPVPRPLRSRTGKSIEAAFEGGNEYQLRVLSHLPGRSLASPWSPDALFHIGATISRLHRALATAQTPPTDFPLLWSLAHTRRLHPYLDLIEGRELRALAREALAAFPGRTLIALRSLPAQLIHNDLSPKNLLFDPGVEPRITGIIDFGDVVAMPRVVDLAIAVGRFASARDPVNSTIPLVAGYLAATRLCAQELEIIPPIVRARLAMRLAIWSSRLRSAGAGTLHPLQEAGDLLRAFAAVADGAFLPASRWLPPVQ